MKIIIPGGTGHVGKILAHAFHKDGHEVVVLSRKVTKAPWRVVQWDGETLGEWAKEFEGADVIINLAGRSVNCRYTSENRKIIIDSRVKSTRIVGEAIAAAERPPRIWLQAATATIYAHRFDAPNDETTGIIGGKEPGVPETWRFSIDVATSWERIVTEAKTPQTRKVLLRSAIILSPDPGGIFSILLSFVRNGLGGPVGNGRQYMSWIHEEDFIRAIYWLIEHNEFSGPVIVASPNPLPQADFNKELRKAWGISFGLPATEWMVEIGTFFLRTESELVLKSRWVMPRRLTEAGFTFDFPTWAPAAEDLCRRFRSFSKT